MEFCPTAMPHTSKPVRVYFLGGRPALGGGSRLVLSDGVLVTHLGPNEISNPYGCSTYAASTIIFGLPALTGWSTVRRHRTHPSLEHLPSPETVLGAPKDGPD